MTKKVLITGGTGFVGGHLLRYLQKMAPNEEYHLTSLHAHKVAGAFVHEIDLTSKEEVEKLIAEIKPNEIYHLAAIASVPASFQDPEGVIKNNFQLTLNVLEAMRLLVPKSKMLMVSSADIYQVENNGRKINEETLVAPANPYSASKAAQDLLAGAYAKSFGLNIVRVRPFNHIGVGQGLGFVVPDFVSQIAKVEKEKDAKIRIGNLEAERDFTAVDDIVAGYALLMKKGGGGEIYNLGQGETITIRELLDRLLKQAKRPIEIEVDPTRLRPSERPYICADVSKAQALGWQAKIPLETTLAEIMDDWREKMI